MGQLVPIQPVTPVAVAVPSFSMQDMERMALAIAKGGLFGANDPNAVLTLLMVAQAEGKHPATAFQTFHIISGKPAKKADAMLVDFQAAGGRVKWHQLDDKAADATFTHPTGGEVRIAWDDARVTQAGLDKNPMHKKYPRAMKRARVVSEGVRTVFPGATSGMWVPEEVHDMVDEPAKPAQVIEGKAVPDTYTLDDARQDIADATDLNTLASRWKARRMQPHRDMLQSELDARKAALTVQDEQPEPSEDLALAIEQVNRKVRVTDVDSLVSDWLNVLPEQEHEALRSAGMARIAAIKEAA